MINVTEQQRDVVAEQLRQQVRADIGDLKLAAELRDLSVPGVSAEEHGRLADQVGAMFTRSLSDHLGQLEALHPAQPEPTGG